jgi:hypothetical protein
VIRETWTTNDVVVSATEPIAMAQFLVGQGYVELQPRGDPSFTIFPPIEQARTEYVFLAPTGWQEHWVVIGAEKDTEVVLDGAPATGCEIRPVGTLDGKEYERRLCPLSGGVHRLSGSAPFQIMAYGYADADAYSFPGGANVRDYEPAHSLISRCSCVTSPSDAASRRLTVMGVGAISSSTRAVYTRSP